MRVVSTLGFVALGTVTAMDCPGQYFSPNSNDCVPKKGKGEYCNVVQVCDPGMDCADHKCQEGYYTAKPALPPIGNLNACAGSKAKVNLPNVDCAVQAMSEVPRPQSGGNVTKGFVGEVVTGSAVPMTDAFWKHGMCTVNVHYHLGSEHYSDGEFDNNGSGPTVAHSRRLLSGEVRLGGQCHHYDAADAKFTTHFDWQHCENTHVGETYEIHWPQSKGGACGTPDQYQEPFYDGVFCNLDNMDLTDPNGWPMQIGVQAQVFTIVNDEDYYYPDLYRGMIVDGDFGVDIAAYTGSTTGTSRNNEICSGYSPITWQVDRHCHMISASSFDKMCADMKATRDDFTSDLEPHGARELVAREYTADNMVDQTRR